LKSIYELGLQAVPAPYDVDRLYNQSRAQNYALKFIRMVLVDRASNQSHGVRSTKLMDEITSMKYFGFLSPLRDDPRPDEVSACCNFAAAKLIFLRGFEG